MSATQGIAQPALRRRSGRWEQGLQEAQAATPARMTSGPWPELFAQIPLSKGLQELHPWATRPWVAHTPIQRTSTVCPCPSPPDPE